jgi:TetR/AcrR family transcriptional repressor of lmrAB and yxaGH operons
MIDTTVRLLRTQGLHATGMNQILKESRAPRGSVYHHFPGGKNQLATAALRAAGQTVVRKIESALNGAADIRQALEGYVDLYAEEIQESGFNRGCPVANVAMDASANSEEFREICSDIFTSWQVPIAQRLMREGFNRNDADDFAEFLLAAIEGAVILGRARRTTAPLHRIKQKIALLLAAHSRREARRAMRQAVKRRKRARTR